MISLIVRPHPCTNHKLVILALAIVEAMYGRANLTNKQLLKKLKVTVSIDPYLTILPSLTIYYVFQKAHKLILKALRRISTNNVSVMYDNGASIPSPSLFLSHPLSSFLMMCLPQSSYISLAGFELDSKGVKRVLDGMRLLRDEVWILLLN